ncbi:hypothetical protein DAPPUDRAFT_319878 [Daphnia pulex]|uniref:Thiopurine S-methyltransferase n=1 Tax=Daphnia pulex TaxID=6669 RepID=E9GN35_DAPPU|nr:hypothetical protein DAPPUDRAFT_319878 [Daphnia pulex]|eukprot:EFX78967.1 hypothetical protein DAPPUDRAFT_319878 [Daphnia pulex]
MEERVEYWSKSAFKIKEGKLRIFVPLCGKTQNLRWLYDLGHEVVGSDGVEKPILEFFKEQGLIYTKGNEGGLPFYAVCLMMDTLKSIAVIYLSWIQKFVESLMVCKAEKSLLNETFGILVDAMQYDQTFPGPPLSSSVEEVKQLFGDTCEVETLLTIDTNADPTSPTSSKVCWNIDECFEVI